VDFVRGPAPLWGEVYFRRGRSTLVVHLGGNLGVYLRDFSVVTDGRSPKVLACPWILSEGLFSPAPRLFWWILSEGLHLFGARCIFEESVLCVPETFSLGSSLPWHISRRNYFERSTVSDYAASCREVEDPRMGAHRRSPRCSYGGFLPVFLRVLLRRIMRISSEYDPTHAYRCANHETQGYICRCQYLRSWHSRWLLRVNRKIVPLGIITANYENRIRDSTAKPENITIESPMIYPYTTHSSTPVQTSSIFTNTSRPHFNI